MALDKLTERRTLTWGDTLIEFEEQNKDIKFTKEEKSYIKKLITRGNEYQEQLNEDWLEYGLMTYQQYMKQIFRYIALQDIIIEDLFKYADSIRKYNKKGWKWKV